MFSAVRVEPARTRTRRAARSTLTRPDSAPNSSRTPEVAAASVNECPVPTGFTVWPRAVAPLTASATSAVLVGRMTADATERWLPAQFTQALPSV